MKWFRDHMWRRKIGMFVLDMVLITLSVYLSMEPAPKQLHGTWRP